MTPCCIASMPRLVALGRSGGRELSHGINGNGF